MAVGVPLAVRSARLERVLRRAVLIAALLLALVALAGGLYLASLPGVGNAERIARRIMAAHGEAPGSLPLPTKVADAVVSTEDEHFYDNVVINVLSGVGRAALAALQTSQDPGGSTIEQQLARRLYGRNRGIAGTLREIGLGVKLALDYDKRQILAMYVNVNYYGHGFWGLRQAAEGYFRTAPSELTWAEAAMLAGLLQAPSAYDPIDHLALARGRQRHVLRQLVANHHLSRAQAAAAFETPLPLSPPAGSKGQTGEANRSLAGRATR